MNGIRHLSLMEEEAAAFTDSSGDSHILPKMNTNPQLGVGWGGWKLAFQPPCRTAGLLAEITGGRDKIVGEIPLLKHVQWKPRC